jgi:hypothetical protein
MARCVLWGRAMCVQGLLVCLYVCLHVWHAVRCRACQTGSQVLCMSVAFAYWLQDELVVKGW